MYKTETCVPVIYMSTLVMCMYVSFVCLAYIILTSKYNVIVIFCKFSLTNDGSEKLSMVILNS